MHLGNRGATGGFLAVPSLRADAGSESRGGGTAVPVDSPHITGGTESDVARISSIFHCSACDRQVKISLTTVPWETDPMVAPDGWERNRYVAGKHRGTFWLCPACAATPKQSQASRAFVVLRHPKIRRAWKARARGEAR